MSDDVTNLSDIARRILEKDCEIFVVTFKPIDKSTTVRLPPQLVLVDWGMDPVGKVPSGWDGFASKAIYLYEAIEMLVTTMRLNRQIGQYHLVGFKEAEKEIEFEIDLKLEAQVA